MGMAEKRVRDGVWDVALTRTVKQGEPATPEYIADITNTSERTVRDVLNVMAESHWLKREVMDDGSVRFKKRPELDWESIE